MVGAKFDGFKRLRDGPCDLRVLAALVGAREPRRRRWRVPYALGPRLHAAELSLTERWPLSSASGVGQGRLECVSCLDGLLYPSLMRTACTSTDHVRTWALTTSTQNKVDPRGVSMISSVKLSIASVIRGARLKRLRLHRAARSGAGSETTVEKELQGNS